MFFILLSSGNIFAQEKRTLIKNRTKDDSLHSETNIRVIPADSLNKDSTNIIVNEEVKDTVPSSVPLKKHGCIAIISDPVTKRINKKDLSLINYTSLSEVLYEELPVYPLSLGGHNLFNHFSVYGGMPAGVNFKYNGRDMVYPETGLFNPAQIPVEFLENIEFLTGSDAVIFGNNSSSALINIQEIRYNTAVPYTRLWLSQSAEEFFGVDGIFSQNFHKNWNFTMGFRSINVKNKFDNDASDSWNLRGKLRWNPSDRTSISLTENFTNYSSNDFGGIDAENTQSINGVPQICNSIYAVPFFKRLNQRIFRHDITLSATTLLFKDSSSIFMSAYLSTFESNMDRSSDLFLRETDTLDYLKYNSGYFGLTGKFEKNISDYFSLIAGGELSSYNVPEGNPYFTGWKGAAWNIFGRLSTEKLAENLKLSGGFRLRNIYGFTSLSTGGKAKIKLNDIFSVSGDYSISESLPTPTTGLDLEKEKHNLILVDVLFKSDNLEADLNLFHRQIGNAIIAKPLIDENNKIISSVFSNDGDRNILGVFAKIKSTLMSGFKLFSLFESGSLVGELSGHFTQSKHNGTSDDRFPAVFGNMKIYLKLRTGESLMDIGLILGGKTGFTGETFLPMTYSYIQQDYESNSQITNIDAFVNLKLGNAFVRLMFKNLLDECYYYTPVYPYPGIHFRMAVSWAFFD